MKKQYFVKIGARLAAILVVMVFLAGLVPPAAAQSNALRLSARPGFDGNFKYGEWLPIWVELENSGADINGEVQVRVLSGAVTNVFAVPVSLPSGARKLVPVYVLPNNFSREVEVQFISENQSLASQKVAVRPQANLNYFIGILAPERGALSLLSGIELPGQHRPLVIVDLGLADLPDRLEALRSFDLLIFNDIDTSQLTPEQANVLKNWVRLGGRLVIGGGAGAQRTVSGLPEEVLPVTVQDLADVDSSMLSAFSKYAEADAPLPEGTFSMALGVDAQGRSLVETPDGQPLVHELGVGSGSVDFVALDLTAAPFEGWSGTGTFWETLVSPGASYPQGMPVDASVRQMRSGAMPYALSNMPVLDLPSMQAVTILLGVYILLIGPINYLVLRWRKRLHLAWVTIPALTAVFSVGAFGLGFSMRGSDLIVNKIGVVELQADADANLTTYLGLFSPGETDYEVSVIGGGLLSPLSEYYDPWGGPFTGGAGGAGQVTYVQGEAGGVRGLSVGQWSMRSFMSEDTWEDFGIIEADLLLSGDTLSGTVLNNTAYTLQDVVILLGKRFMRLGDLAPGDEAQVSLQIKSLEQERWSPPLSYALFETELSQPSANGPNREFEMKRSIIEGVFERSPWVKMGGAQAASSATGALNVSVLGWMNEAPPEVTISGRPPAQKVTTLVYSPVSYRMPAEGSISLAPGLVSGTLLESPREGGICGDASSVSVYIVNGEAVFEYLVPQGLKDFEVNTLKLSIWTDGGWWGTPELAIYDWAAGEWAVLSDTVQGINVIGNAQSMVSDLGQIRVRMTGQNLQSCYFLDMGLEASR